MKIIIRLFTFLVLTLISIPGFAQIKKVVVEKYYISDTFDATDSLAGTVPVGSTTYRIFIDLEPNSKIIKIYGDQYHPLKIESTQNFYNNYDRPDKNFGYLINKNWFEDNPMLALDSWLTLGLASTNQLGILKSDDYNGSDIGGSNNFGGTAAVSGGLMINADPLAGIPVTTSDGFLPSTTALGQWTDNGFKDSFGDDSSVFGPTVIGNSFISYDAFLKQNSGLSGVSPDSNSVLVAQLTTIGDLSFELNLEVEISDGINSTIIKYVANNDTLLPGEEINPALKYPPVCGCTDPDFLEYSLSYACSDNQQCITPVVLGCMDPMACNFDLNANFSVPSLCCYPGLCNDRDLAVVCPGISSARMGFINSFPNPASNEITFEFNLSHLSIGTLTVFDSMGKLVYEKNVIGAENSVLTTINLNGMADGLYLIRLSEGSSIETTTFLKKN